ncbi:hypothetical protein [Mycobacterium sp.]|uniref:hypothetical protein n=1 Tax=Mycobacterium sp. TaxID=1785 RepID=UPI003C7766EC
MRRALARYREFYGSHPLHLLTMLAGFALLAYIIAVIKPQTLWNPQVWWQSIAVWFAAAVIGHDLVLFPLYSFADRLLTLPAAKRTRQPAVPAVNYVRVPALGSALTLLVFLPGIIEQGAPTYQAATGQTQEPFFARWLLLTATMFAVSAVIYAIRLLRRRPDWPPPAPPPDELQ